jgi:hypothetical protein
MNVTRSKWESLHNYGGIEGQDIPCKDATVFRIDRRLCTVV